MIENGNARGKNFFLKFRRIIWIIISTIKQYRCNARVPEDDLKKSGTEVSRGKDLFFSFKIFSQQGGVLTIPCLVVAASCSFEALS
jgi:hypothetical protein